MGSIETEPDIFFSPTGGGGSEGDREAEGAKRDQQAAELAESNRRMEQKQNAKRVDEINRKLGNS